MIKKIYLLVIFLTVLISLFLLKRPPTPTFKPILFNLEEIIDKPSVVYNPHLTAMNSRNIKIKNIVYPKIRFKVEGFKLEAKLLYEKNQRFRMANWSILGKETDIGSNDEIFWFWSKRMEPPAIYYAKHEDLYKTRLRTPFHPLWMMEIVGINTIDLENSLVFEHDNKLAVVQNKLSVLGQPIIRIYLIDPQKQAFVGHYIYDKKGKLIVSAEINDFYEINEYFLPKSITINWVEENIEIVWNMDCPIINCNIDSCNWDCNIPNKKRIDLNGYIPKSFLVF